MKLEKILSVQQYLKKEGLVKEYYKTSLFNFWKVSSVGHLKNFVREGLWEYFNEDGSLTRTESYKDGKLVE